MLFLMIAFVFLLGLMTLVMLGFIAGIIAIVVMKALPFLKFLDREVRLPSLPKLPRDKTEPFRVVHVVLCHDPLGRQGYFAGHLFGRPVFLPRKEDALVFDARDHMALRRVIERLGREGENVFIVRR